MSKWYEECKAKGLCVVCGKPKDRLDRVRCTACAQKGSEEKRKDYKYWLEKGMCTKCHHYPVYGGRVVCVECLAKQREAVEKYHSKIKEQKGEEYNITKNERARKLYNERADKGLCPVCGKKRNDIRYVCCEMCRYKARERDHSIDDYAQDVTHKRIEAGVCYQCGKPRVKGYEVCEKHLEKKREITRKARKKREKQRQELLASQEN